MNAQELREALESAAKRRAKAERARAAATEDMKAALKVVQESKALSIAEAARLSGISRVAVYNMLNDRR